MLSENDGDCQERISRRVEFKTSYSVESLTSGSSDGESYSPRLPHVRRRDSLLQRTKSFSQIIHEMGSNTKKLEEEMYGLLRDMDTLRNQNLSTGRRLQRLQRVSGAMKEQLQAFSPVRSAASHRHLNHTNIMTMNEKRNCYSIENLPTEST
ncbi:uncharacterized protein [Pocillopora verrucosa]|uniref:uncharacterized protein LOC113671492 n=1 Tax=Pocillopora damicornis TaxID=46731 RepID=UPI000F551BFA|nr:uncharacterized protein LOC113671492 [Pocillopora damicornis]XP_058962681.1 uncharacterized protein LOC131789545 [Pocillopora verrucosa]